MGCRVPLCHHLRLHRREFHRGGVHDVEFLFVFPPQSPHPSKHTHTHESSNRTVAQKYLPDIRENGGESSLPPEPPAPESVEDELEAEFLHAQQTAKDVEEGEGGITEGATAEEMPEPAGSDYEEIAAGASETTGCECETKYNTTDRGCDCSQLNVLLPRPVPAPRGQREAAGKDSETDPALFPPNALISRFTRKLSEVEDAVESAQTYAKTLARWSYQFQSRSEGNVRRLMWELQRATQDIYSLGKEQEAAARSAELLETRLGFLHGTVEELQRRVSMLLVAVAVLAVVLAVCVVAAVVGCLCCGQGRRGRMAHHGHSGSYSESCSISGPAATATMPLSSPVQKTPDPSVTPRLFVMRTRHHK